jgi:hypothetical protein
VNSTPILGEDTGEIYTDTGRNSIATRRGHEIGYASSGIDTSERGSGNPTGSVAKKHRSNLVG